MFLLRWRRIDGRALLHWQADSGRRCHSRRQHARPMDAHSASLLVRCALVLVVGLDGEEGVGEGDVRHVVAVAILRHLHEQTREEEQEEKA